LRNQARAKKTCHEITLETLLAASPPLSALSVVNKNSFWLTFQSIFDSNLFCCTSEAAKSSDGGQTIEKKQWKIGENSREINKFGVRVEESSEFAWNFD
jgi:hypothetical protein